MARSTLIGGAYLISFIAFAPAAEAQTAGADTPSTTVAPRLDEIVVTAQRKSERLKDVPLTVTALSGQDLARAGVNSIQNLATVVSGFTFGGLGTTAQPGIRGVTSTISAAGSENPNAVYLDGVYQVAATALTFNLPDIERIEVLKGPQGTLFGRNATGGAIQIFTKGPKFDPGLDLNLEEGAYTGSGSSRASNHLKISAFGTAPIVNDVIAISLAGGYEKTDGYQTNDHTNTRTGMIDDKLVRGKILITPTDNLRILATAFYAHKHDNAGNSYTPVDGLSSAAGLPGAVISTEPWHAAADTKDGVALLRQYGGSLKVDWHLDLGTLSSLTGYTNTKNKNLDTSIHGAYCPPEGIASFQCLDSFFLSKNRETEQEINFTSRDFGIFSFTAGAFYYHGTGSTLNTLQFDVVATNNTNSVKSLAGYGQVTIKPFAGLSIIAGVRQTHDKQHDFNLLSATPTVPFNASRSATTPRISVTYAVTPHLNVYGTFSKGYKSGLTGATNNGNAIKPERITAYEAGLKFATGRLTMNGAFFYYDYTDLQVQGYDGFNTNISNAAKAKIYGFDGDMSIALTQTVTFRGTLSWLPKAEYKDFTSASYATPIRNPVTGLFYQSTDPANPDKSFSSDVSGSRLIRAPRLSASATIAYRDELWNGKFDASATLAYSSHYDTELSRFVSQDGYATLAAEAGFRPGGGRLRIGIYGRNLTNKAYLQSGLTSAYGLLAVYAPPREAGASFGYSF